jgi:hypothetical protein
MGAIWKAGEQRLFQHRKFYRKVSNRLHPLEGQREPANTPLSFPKKRRLLRAEVKKSEAGVPCPAPAVPCLILAEEHPGKTR